MKGWVRHEKTFDNVEEARKWAAGVLDALDKLERNYDIFFTRGVIDQKRGQEYKSFMTIREHIDA